MSREHRKTMAFSKLSRKLKREALRRFAEEGVPAENLDHDKIHVRKIGDSQVELRFGGVVILIPAPSHHEIDQLWKRYGGVAVGCLCTVAGVVAMGYAMAIANDRSRL